MSQNAHRLGKQLEGCAALLHHGRRERAIFRLFSGGEKPTGCYLRFKKTSLVGLEQDLRPAMRPENL